MAHRGETTEQLVYPLKDCAITRETIQWAGDWFFNLEFTPIPTDSDYDECQEELSSVLNQATEAFENRPTECKMTVGDDDRYECSHCDFGVHISAEDIN